MYDNFIVGDLLLPQGGSTCQLTIPLPFPPPTSIALRELAGEKMKVLLLLKKVF